MCIKIQSFTVYTVIRLFFLEQFQKPEYDAVERVFTKVNMESFYCVLILTYDRINYFQLICGFYLLMLTKYTAV